MPKKQGNGDGSIFYDEKRKRWRGQITLGTDSKGKLVRKSVSGKNKTEVREKIKDLLATNADINLKSDDVTVKEWLEIWFENYSKPKLSINSYKGYKNVVDNYLIPYLGYNRLRDLTTLDVQKAYNVIFGDRNKYSQAFARKIANVLNTALKQAVIDKYISSNPCIGAFLPKVRPPRKVVAMTIEDQKIMVERWKGDPLCYIFIFMLATGMRISEATGLTWEFVDLENRKLEIKKIMIEISGRAEFKDSAKTESGNRTMYLNEMAMSILCKQKDLIEDKLNFLDLVFPNNNYNFRCTANLRRLLDRTFKETGVKRYNMHALRHTYATRMVEKGVNIKFLQETLGHKRVETTLQIYSSALADFQRKQADEINIFD